jgi:DNA-binding NtrC family response regulator
MPKLIKRPRVFVVDDDAAIASSLAMILRRHGFAVVCFTEPCEVLQAARFSVPEVLLADVIMPLKSGVDLAAEIQKLCPGCGVLLFSGQDSAAGLLAAAQAEGMSFEFLAKPVQPEELLRRVEQVTMAWAALEAV